MMIKYIIDAIGVVFELFIVHYFLSYMIKKRLSKKVVFIVYPISFILMFFSMLLPYSIYIYPVLMFFIVFHLAVFYKNKLFIKLLFGFLLTIMFMAADSVVESLLVLITQVEMNSFKENVALHSTAVLGSKLLVFLLVKIIGYNRAGVYKNISKTTFIALLLTPISSLAAMYAISISLEHYKNTASLIAILCSSILLIVSNIFMFSVFEKQIKNEQIKAKLDYTEKQLEQQVEHYKLLQNQQTEIRKLSHDMKHYVHIMQELGNPQNEQHIENIKKELSKYDTFYNTGNLALDALLHAKNNEMKTLEIEFTSSIIMPEKLNINAYDLCIILGNAIDNAIEACEKIIEIKKRYINLRINTQKKYISIHIENPTNENFVPSLERKTTKPNAAIHGYGLDSIETIALKYDGDITIECDNYCFKLSILLKN